MVLYVLPCVLIAAGAFGRAFGRAAGSSTRHDLYCSFRAGGRRGQGLPQAGRGLPARAMLVLVSGR